MRGLENYQKPMNTWPNTWMLMSLDCTILSAMEHRKPWYRYCWFDFSQYEIRLIHCSFLTSEYFLYSTASDRLHRTRIAGNSEANFWIWICECLSFHIQWVCSPWLCECVQRGFTWLWNVFVSIEWVPGAANDTFYATILFGISKRKQPTQASLCWGYA